MDAMKSAILKRRQKLADPSAYMDEEDQMARLSGEIAEGDEMASDVEDDLAPTDLAPELSPMENGDALTDEATEEMLGEPEDPEELARMEAIFDQGATERPGLRGKAMKNIKGMIDKMRS
jgi:hypothetical protein